ncbi:hypothetical protein SLE2022_317150 [Rubroshorea leprosula]
MKLGEAEAGLNCIPSIHFQNQNTWTVLDEKRRKKGFTGTCCLGPHVTYLVISGIHKRNVAAHPGRRRCCYYRIEGMLKKSGN